MSINFPSSPTPGQLYTYGDNTWVWSGDYWGVYSAQTGYVTSVTSSGSGFPVINSYSNNSLVLKSFSGTNMTITDSGGQLNFYVPLNGGSGGQLYYFNISKTQTPYLEIATSATTGSEQSITSAVTSGNTITLGQFLTPSGSPGVSIIPGGVWSFFLHSYKQNSSASFDIFCDVYKRTTGGTETYLFSSDPVQITSNSPTPSISISDVYYSGTTLDTLDRILVNVRVTNTSSSTYSATFISEGLQHYSYFSSPLLLPTTDTYVDSFTYTPSANTITIGQTQNYPSQSVTINSFSGLSVGTLSATTYQNLPATPFLPLSGGTVTGATSFTNGLTANTISATTISATTISSTGDISSQNNLRSLNSVGDEGGEIFLNKAVTNTTISGGVTIDVFQNRVRIFEQGGTNRGGYYDITSLGAGASTNFQAISSSGTTGLLSSTDWKNFNDIVLISDGIPGTPITGGTTLTRSLIKSYLIPANTFASGDTFEVWVIGSKVNTNSSWYINLSFNTSNTLVGSTDIGRSFSNAVTVTYLIFQRIFNFTTSTNLRGSVSNSGTGGESNLVSVSVTNSTFNTAVDNWFLFTIIPATGGTADIFNIEKVIIRKMRYRITV